MLFLVYLRIVRGRILMSGRNRLITRLPPRVDKDAAYHLFYFYHAPPPPPLQLALACM
ncbi:mCG140166 [Mus musculus]|nr:mCG140166 [Mus musculus]